MAADGETYTFNLRQGVTFSNGDPFNSYQVWGDIYGLYFIDANSSAFMNGYNMFNTTAVRFGPATITLMNQSGLVNPSSALMNIMTNSSWPIYVTGPNTIVFHLSSPFNFFVGTLISVGGLLFDTQYVLQHGGFGTPGSFNTYFNQNPIPGTGPYAVTKVSENSFVEFSQNPTYWGRNLTQAQISANPYIDPGHFKNVVISAKTDDISRYVDLSTGVTQLSSIYGSDYALVQNNSKYGQLSLGKDSNLFYIISLNTQRYPTNITLVRQAIVHAINYSNLAKVAFYGGITQYNGPSVPADGAYYNFGNQSVVDYFNLTLAKQEIAAAKLSSPPTITYLASSTCSICSNIAEAIQGDLQNIGINVNIQIDTESSFSSLMYLTYAQNVNMSQQIPQMASMGGFFAPTDDTPIDWWIYLVSNSSLVFNDAVYSNPIVQPCVKDLIGTTNTTLIQSACTTAQEQINNDVPYIFLGLPNLPFGTGTIVWNKAMVNGGFVDPTSMGDSTTMVFNTVTPAS